VGGWVSTDMAFSSDGVKRNPPLECAAGDHTGQRGVGWYPQRCQSRASVRQPRPPAQRCAFCRPGRIGLSYGAPQNGYEARLTMSRGIAAALAPPPRGPVAQALRGALAQVLSRGNQWMPDAQLRRKSRRSPPRLAKLRRTSSARLLGCARRAQTGGGQMPRGLQRSREFNILQHQSRSSGRIRCCIMGVPAADHPDRFGGHCVPHVWGGDGNTALSARGEDCRGVFATSCWKLAKRAQMRSLHQRGLRRLALPHDSGASVAAAALLASTVRTTPRRFSAKRNGKTSISRWMSP